MTDEKPRLNKSTKSDSPQPKEPIDFSGLMQPDIEAEDDGIIELTEEVKMSSESENEATDIKDQGQKVGEDEGEKIEDPDHTFMKTEEEVGWIEVSTELSHDEPDGDPEEDEDLFSLIDEAPVESEEHEDIADAKGTISWKKTDDDGFLSLTDEKAIEPENNEHLLKPIDESDLDLEDDESSFMLTDESDFRSNDDEVLDITEFDEQLPSEDQATMDLADKEEQTAEDDEEFLELIDIDEESPAEDERVINFNTTEDEMEDAEIDNLFRKSLNEDIEFDQNVEDEVAESLGMELGPEIDMSADLAEDDNRDLKIDIEAVTTPKEEPETILFENSATDTADVSDHEEILESDENPPEDTQTHDGAIELGALSSQQIEQAVERLIQQNYSEKIESLITQVVEEAVSKEIEKLKNILLNDLSNDE
jgi:hypothetical protein